MADKSVWPFGLTAYILAIATSAFACSVRDLPWWYQLLVAVMPVVAVVNLWLTNLTDPGIIPPLSEKDAVVELLDDGHTDIPDRSRYVKDAKGRWMRAVVTPEGYGDFEKYCTVCNVWRPQRGYHCTVCGHCMERGDHHCEVMGNCIAKLNHRFFALFLCSAQVGCALMMGGAIWRLQRLSFPNKDVWDNAETYVLLILAVFYGYHALMLVFGTFHAFAVVCDVTTKDMAGDEVCRNLPCLPGKRNPTALLRSWRAVCCGPIIWRSSTRVTPLLQDQGEAGGREV
mmetsp:Transcript_31854/g.70774  ORF Transcript_31854/g.70774 Transcript_31854/m.70774 type:complete len:285 (+) Transcript_31854:58-912(+)